MIFETILITIGLILGWKAISMIWLLPAAIGYFISLCTKPTNYSRLWLDYKMSKRGSVLFLLIGYYFAGLVGLIFVYGIGYYGHKLVGLAF